MNNVKLAVAFYDSNGLSLEIFDNTIEAYDHLEHFINRQKISIEDKKYALKNIRIQFKALAFNYSGLLQDETAEDNFENSIVAEFSIKRIG